MKTIEEIAKQFTDELFAGDNIKKMKRDTKYSSRVWVNPEDSAATGSIVCYDGYLDDERVSFMEIASCHSKARLHMYKDSTPEEFIGKLKLVRQELDKFISHLENKPSEKIIDSNNITTRQELEEAFNNNYIIDLNGIYCNCSSALIDIAEAFKSLNISCGVHKIGEEEVYRLAKWAYYMD